VQKTPISKQHLLKRQNLDGWDRALAIWATGSVSRGIQLCFLKLRDESVLSGGNVVMRNKGGASKSYGKGTFCLFGIMIYINKSTTEKTCHSRPRVTNEVLDILPLTQHPKTNGHFFYQSYFLSL